MSLLSFLIPRLCLGAPLAADNDLTPKVNHVPAAKKFSKSRVNQYSEGRAGRGGRRAKGSKGGMGGNLAGGKRGIPVDLCVNATAWPNLPLKNAMVNVPR